MVGDRIVLKELPGNRYFEAGMALEAGEPLLVCLPLAFAATDSYKKRVCAHCMQCVSVTLLGSTEHNEQEVKDEVEGGKGLGKSSLHYSCRKCDQVFTCSSECMDALNRNGHGRICSALRKLATFKASVHEKSILKLLLMACLARTMGTLALIDSVEDVSDDLCDRRIDGDDGAGLAPLIQQLSIQNDSGSISADAVIATARSDNHLTERQTDNSNDSTCDWISDMQLCGPPSFQDFMDLQSHFSSWTSDMTHEWRKSLAFLIKLLVECDVFPCNDIPTHSAESQQLIMHMVSRIESNCFGIWKSHGKEACMGRAVFPAASYFNHSCVPNCESIKQGNQMAFRTLQKIAAGDMLTISYIDTNIPVSARRARLMDDYFFLCLCERCVKESELDSTSPRSKVSYSTKKYQHGKRRPKKGTKPLLKSVVDPISVSSLEVPATNSPT
ncbi:hypothetical protein BASA50_000277 [Batrachochytrium salamandrivorans]|uniref:SET domain-containing protein n=1 Tax=Batrachochytrium salamandrivorans TaxID=1357716 RepID=A0ABQ8EUS2_9FUNG|nr:hypothetical protein BASA62_009971 [Batrachochytrium salamandrivorans]KAH6586913.1 hypothetical protein BASA50_000277 [Batrachochytrium salamandrivorans]KAH9274616.1 hypothetical protein BASA83_002800 [Batrachochytrium salamandrivorans]KAJ1342203.1 hypothetical protein BSLG_003126 [Batrachochytrium salamandrivorans]